MIYHILNGDGLAHSFNLVGEKIICRECLIEGEVFSKSLQDFWKVRANFIKQSYNDDNYFEKVKGEFDKFDKISKNDEVNLWFGNEVFCQVNLWFCLSVLQNSNAKIYRIFPDSIDWKCDFTDLDKSINNRKLLTNNDLVIGHKLWKEFS